jgi:phosphoribosylanthranilate isomerase
VINHRVKIAAGSVKICGNRNPELCRVAVESGANLLGFIFVPGVKRLITPEAAAECVAEVSRAADRRVLTVGVFVDEKPAVMNRHARIAGLDLVQLHGDEPAETLSEIDVPVVKVFRPKPADALDGVRRRLESYLRVPNAPIAFLIDGYDPRQHGGIGVRADWGLTAALSKVYPVMLAGGLTPENVGSAIEAVRPLGVDVSSGVEMDGVRDADRIKQFIAEAKAKFATRLVNQSAF